MLGATGSRPYNGRMIPTAVSELAVPGLHYRITALGLAQITAWGTLYYAIAVLAAPMGASLQLSPTVIYGGFSVALLASGFISPWVGRRIDRDGGRSTLMLAALLGGLAFAVLGAAESVAAYFCAWLLAGLAMGCGLYDAVLAVLNRLAPGAGYRRAVTGLTLFGGFASTVFWPLTHWLVTYADWRTACWIYALLQWGFCLPLYRWAVPVLKVAPLLASATPAAAPTPRSSKRFVALAAAFALVSFAFSVLSAHLIELLVEARLSVADAIAVGAAFGPMQVLARMVEFGLAPHSRAVTVGRVAFGLMAIALLTLSLIDGQRWLAFTFALLYGASNGILTIVRGTVPAELFGREHYGALLGTLALPSFVAKAIAPLLFALTLSAGVSHAHAMLGLAAAGTLALISFEIARYRA